MDVELLIAFSLFTVGFLYASVGHGGASGYLAVLSLWSVPVYMYRPFILVLNILVAGAAFVQFSRADYFKWKLTWPFLITSLPMAFIGSQFPVTGHVFNLLLGAALVVPVIRLLGFFSASPMRKKEVNFPFALMLGAVIGVLSGMLSIGGGIFLSPVLILLAWADAKEAAAVSSLFIVLNSASGLLGHPGGFEPDSGTSTWFLSAAAGGLAGAYFGSHRFAQSTVRYMLTAVLAIASCKLLFFMS